MKLTRYLYKGPQSAATLRLAEPGELLEVQLMPGSSVGLPADHEYVHVLLALKHLELLPEGSVETDALNAPEVPQSTDAVISTAKKGGKA